MKITEVSITMGRKDPFVSIGYKADVESGDTVDGVEIALTIRCEKFLTTGPNVPQPPKVEPPKTLQLPPNPLPQLPPAPTPPAKPDVPLTEKQLKSIRGWAYYEAAGKDAVDAYLLKVGKKKAEDLTKGEASHILDMRPKKK